MGDGDPIYKKGPFGPRPDIGPFGQRHTSEPFGPRIKRSLLTNEPVPVRNGFGLPVKLPDGSALYETTTGFLGGGEGAIVGLAILVLIVAAAITISLLVAALFVLAIVVNRFVESLRADIAARRLSVTTVGIGLPLITLPIIMAIIAVTPWKTENFQGNMLFLVAVVVFEAWLVGLFYFAPTRVGSSLRAALSGQDTWKAVGGWTLVTAFAIFFAIDSNTKPYAAVDAIDAANAAALDGAVVVAVIAGVCIGLLRLLRGPSESA